MARARRGRRRTAALTLLRHPRRSLAILWARLTGQRLRARQALAALIGIAERIDLPPALAARHPAATEPFRDPDLVVLGQEGHALVAGAAEAIRAAFADAEVQAIYGDALVETAPGGAIRPLLRPAFDPVLLAGIDYVGPVVALRRSALAAIGAHPGIAAPDALFRVAERFGARSIGHLPRILSRSQAWKAPDPAEELARHRAIVRAHLDRTGRADAEIATDGDTITVSDPIPDPAPLVSLIVPTRDRLDLLRPCVESLLGQTDWPALELLICDNDSREPETRAYLNALAAAGRARIVPWPGPFDFAGMNNAAAAAARGTLLAFVNNDVAVIGPDWLRRMAAEALRPEVGAVGPKLIDGAGRIQHAGIVLGTGGLVTHAYRHFPGDAPGHLGELRATRAVSAVTAACLVVEAAKFRAVGGFDAARFAVDFNDVDLCLRLNAAGHRARLVPGAVLHHYEGLSRRRSPEAEARHAREIEALRRRWGPLLAQDPHYHPDFDPALSTHARLRPGRPAADDAALRRAPY